MTWDLLIANERKKTKEQQRKKIREFAGVKIRAYNRNNILKPNGIVECLRHRARPASLTLPPIYKTAFNSGNTT
jgi:hypothetical protein